MKASVLRSKSKSKKKSRWKKSSGEEDEEDVGVFGAASIVLRGASIDDLLSYTMDYESMYFQKHECGNTTKFERVLEQVNPHHRVFHSQFSLSPFTDREFVMSCIFEKQSSKQCIIIVRQTHHKNAPLTTDKVRAETTRVFRLTEVGRNKTKFEVIFCIDLKGFFPPFVTEKFVIPISMATPLRAQTYFLQIQRKGDFDEGGEDGRLLGQLLMDSLLGSHDFDVALSKFFRRTAVLREASASHLWFELFIGQVAQNNLRPAFKINTPLDDITDDDAKKIGSSFALTLMSSLAPASAVDEYIYSYPALQQLDERVHVFRPFLLGIAICLLRKADWGMNMRVGFGAGISVADMISDIYMIYEFLTTGHARAAVASIMFVSINLSVQLVLVYAQNRRKSRRAIFYAMLLVLSCAKPGVDAYLIIMGEEKDPFANFDIMTEMTFCKIFELVLEAIPSGVLQLTIFVTSDTKTLPALISLFLSAASTGYTSATLSYDHDTSVVKRRETPSSWGMVPDQGRGFVFFLMFVLSTLQVVSKVFATALLALTNPRWLAIWFATDLGLFYSFKIATRDFVHYTRGFDGVMKYVLACFARLGEKIGADFCGLMVVRTADGACSVYYDSLMCSLNSRRY